MNEITASIVLHDTPESQVERLVDCIRQSSVRVHVYVIDNSPNPIDIPLFHAPGISYLKAERNKGYGAGHNIALRQVINTAEFHFVLNPDISFGREELEKMIGFMKNNAAVGQLMPKVVYRDGSLQHLCKLLPTPADLFLRRFAVGPLKTRATKKNDRFELRFAGYKREMDVPFLSGCFMLFRTDALRKVGLFDERFFMYAEDIDITRRMHAQYRTVFFPGASVVHDHSRASYKNARALLMHTISSLKYFNKWGWIWDSERTKVNRQILSQFDFVEVVDSKGSTPPHRSRPLTY